MSSLLRASWLAGMCSNRRAYASTVSESSPGGHTWDTSPMRWAVAASMASPDSRNCLACSSPSRYTHSMVVGVPKMRDGA